MFKKPNNKIKGLAANGATCTIHKLDTGTAGGATNCTQAQFDAYKLARMQADPRNDGSIEKARETLTRAGWEVYYVD